MSIFEIIGVIIGFAVIYGISAIVGYGAMVLIDKLINRKRRR